MTDSGRARTILPHPTDPNIVYFLTSSGGLWKTTDFQKNKPHWVSLTDGVITTSGGAVAFGRDPDTLYLGLGDPFDGNAAAGAYVLKSTDGGNTWGPAVRLLFGGTSAGSVRDLKVDTSGRDRRGAGGNGHWPFSLSQWRRNIRSESQPPAYICHACGGFPSIRVEHREYQQGLGGFHRSADRRRCCDGGN